MSKFKEVSLFLNEIGVRVNIMGYNYLRSSILMVMDDIGMNPKAITTIVYPKVAEEFDTTPTRVERAIRHAISNISPFNQTRNKVFPYITGNMSITNKEFIYGAANYLYLYGLEEEKRGA